MSSTDKVKKSRSKDKIFSVDRSSSSKKDKHKSSKHRSSSSKSDKEHKSSKRHHKERESDEKGVVPVKVKKSVEKSRQRLEGSQKDLQDLLESRETDTFAIAAQREMLRKLNNMIPVAEQIYLKYPKQSNAYAFNVLVSQMRELISDLQAHEDRSIVLDRIVMEVLDPASQTLASFLIENNFRLKKILDDTVKADEKKRVFDHLDTVTKQSGAYARQLLIGIKDRIEKLIGEN
jgi:hypothetical protein